VTTGPAAGQGLDQGSAIGFPCSPPITNASGRASAPGWPQSWARRYVGHQGAGIPPRRRRRRSGPGAGGPCRSAVGCLHMDPRPLARFETSSPTRRDTRFRPLMSCGRKTPPYDHLPPLPTRNSHQPPAPARNDRKHPRWSTAWSSHFRTCPVVASGNRSTAGSSCGQSKLRTDGARSHPNRRIEKRYIQPLRTH
jgi:hypothetical protein